MSKTEIDYSNTIIYKITCKDPLVTDLYVGHTTNFVQRKHGHKQSCINEKSCNYNCKLYKAIRANGGWDNWVMEIVAFFKCNDLYEARIKEQEYFTSLNATLNSLEPLPKPKSIETPEEVNKEIVKKPYFCETCNVTLQDNQLLESHNQTKKHCKKVMGVDTIHNAKFYCKCCDYSTSRKSSYDEHLLSKKHQKSKVSNHNLQKMCNEYVCQNCNKKYKDNSGLWRHKKTCNFEDNLNNLDIKENTTDKDQLILMLVKQNTELIKETSDFKNMMVDQQNMIMKVLENCTTYNTTISQNKATIE